MTANPGARPNLQSVDTALKTLLRDVGAVAEVEEVATIEAVSRVLAASQVSRVAVPSVDNSAMDGYAVACKDIKAGGETRLEVSQRIPAGLPAEPLASGTAARLFTGAPVPAGADAVVMQERCRADGDGVVIQGEVHPGQHIRRAGEDIGTGQQVLAAGLRLLPQHLGLAASVGLATLPVFRRLRVAVFFSGDELVEPGHDLQPGQLYNSNRFTLIGLLRVLGCEVVDLGIVADDMASTVSALEQAAAQADLIVTSGGVSVGEEDYVRLAVEQLGQLDLWRIAVKPGKPLAFGRVHDTPFLGLPGNPVSVFVTFCLFARPYILRLQGMEGVMPHLISAVADFDWPQAGSRREYLRARIDGAGKAHHAVILYPHQGSGVLTSVGWANGLAVIPAGETRKRGDAVDFLPFNELLL